MKYKIHYNGKYEDQIIVEADTIEEIKELAFSESDSRGWDKKDCWSEKV